MYIGKHSTYNLEDGYLGSGKTLIKAIHKYGKQNFKRQILHYCLDETHAYEMESFIVDELFINRIDTYNISVGGIGTRTGSKNFMYGKTHSDEIKQKLSILARNMIRTSESNTKRSNKLKGRKLSESTIKSISLSNSTRVLSDDSIYRNRLSNCKNMYLIYQPTKNFGTIVHSLPEFKKYFNCDYGVVTKHLNKGIILSKRSKFNGWKFELFQPIS
jgi:hypothetical protein